MKKYKLTLTSLLVRRHLWAAAVTLSIVLILLLGLTDLLNLHAHRSSLARDVQAIDTIDIEAPSSPGIYTHNDEKRTNYLLLDEKGHWYDEDISHQHPVQHNLQHTWAMAATVVKNDTMQGHGQLPWVKDSVVWAASVMGSPEGQPMILVAWRHINAIRETSYFIYGIVIVAILIAFAVSGIIALRTARYVTSVIDTIATTSSQIAEKNYDVALPAQPTDELNRVSTSITQLAYALSKTSEELQNERQRLSRLEQLQRQFVADASHEMRAPLTSMQVTLEAWQDGVLCPDEQHAALGQLLHETERLGTLVANLLDLSRIESGRETVILQPVAIKDMFNQVTAIFKYMTRLPILVDIPPDIEEIQADPHALARILVNLLENACRFTPESGNITLWARVDNPGITLGVTDTGNGIAPDELIHIWDRFARSAQARADGTAGSGLGLAIVKGLTEAMHGTVGAESVLNEGSSFWVTFLPIT